MVDILSRGYSMVERVLLGGLLAALIGSGTFSTAWADDAHQPSPSSVILNLLNRPTESSEKAMTEAIREGALAPKPSPVEEWVLQPDGSMRNTRTGVGIAVRNVCAPGDMEHESALAAYKQAQASKLRRH
jgi:hypothetical protein